MNLSEMIPEVASNEITSDFRESKMTNGGHFVKLF